MCVCMDFIGVVRCLFDGKIFYFKYGYWVGLVNGKFVIYICLIGYCNFLS